MNSDIVICYLCNKKVAYNEWVKQETGHRSYCAVKSKEHRGKLFDPFLDKIYLKFGRTGRTLILRSAFPLHSSFQ